MRSGARLDEQGKARLADINERLASLGAQFGQNVQKDEADWALFITDETELAGLPDFVRDSMRGAAEERNRPDAWAVTLSRSIIEPFLSFSENRALREKSFRAWAARGENGGETDNTDIVAEMVSCVRKRPICSAMKASQLTSSMTRWPRRRKRLWSLLEPVWDKANAHAPPKKKPICSGLITGEGRNHKVDPWDWRYYAEKLRNERFAFDEAELKPYLQLEKSSRPASTSRHVCSELRSRRNRASPTWHPDVRVWEVFNADGSKRGLFLGDYFNRQSKRSGAWMSALQSQHKLDWTAHNADHLQCHEFRQAAQGRACSAIA